jgi:hypothetical protein
VRSIEAVFLLCSLLVATPTIANEELLIKRITWEEIDDPTFSGTFYKLTCTGDTTGFVYASGMISPPVSGRAITEGGNLNVFQVNLGTQTISFYPFDSPSEVKFVPKIKQGSYSKSLDVSLAAAWPKKGETTDYINIVVEGSASGGTHISYAFSYVTPQPEYIRQIEFGQCVSG